MEKLTAEKIKLVLQDKFKSLDEFINKWDETELGDYELSDYGLYFSYDVKNCIGFYIENYVAQAKDSESSYETDYCYCIDALENLIDNSVFWQFYRDHFKTRRLGIDIIYTIGDTDCIAEDRDNIVFIVEEYWVDEVADILERLLDWYYEDDKYEEAFTALNKKLFDNYFTDNEEDEE